MSSDPSISGPQVTDIPEKPPGSKDIGWNYGKLVKKGDYNDVQCKKCNRIVKGGIFRFKQHIAGITGDVARCPNASDDDRAKCKANLEEIKKKKSDKKVAEYQKRQEVQISESRETEEPDLASIGSKRSRVFGPLDKMVDEGKLKQTVINECERKKWKELADSYVALWVYSAGIPFHALSIPEFDLMCEAIGKHGPGYKGPSQYQLRVPLLKQACEKVDDDLKAHKKLWEEYGCSILTDGWTDRKHRSIMNLCVPCKEGTSFVKSVEDSDIAHTGEYIFKWVDECIKEVGEKHVIQVVTDNASSNMAANERMRLERPNLFWTSCAAHTIDLMLEDIAKIPKYIRGSEGKNGYGVSLCAS